MLLRIKPCKTELRILRDVLQKRASAGLLIILRYIYIHKSRMEKPGRGDVKEILPCPDPDGKRAVYSIRHPAGRKSPPDQLIKSELVPGKGLLYSRRRSRDICRTNRFVCVLGIPVHIVGCLLPVGGISEFSRDILPGCSIRLDGYSCGIRSQICDKTDRSLAFDIDAFIELLRDPHGLRRGKIQRLGSLLLQRAGREREGCFFDPLAVLYISNLILCMLEFFTDRPSLFLRGDRHLPVRSEEMRGNRLFLTADIELRIDRPVL